MKLKDSELFDTITSIQMRPKLTLTRPKEPELETAQRVRALRIKSSAELEEEMLAKVPKFKALPLNKKILQCPSLPKLPRSTPQQPDFHEFHLKTMERANQHAETVSVVSSVDASSLNQCKPLKLTEPRPPILETALRARPTKIKSSQELELEELEKIPKFKARPLNKKIFESKGDLGLHCQSKPHITAPQEFHFATDDRLGPPPSTMMIESFDKLSLHSESSHQSFSKSQSLILSNPIQRDPIPLPERERRPLTDVQEFVMHVDHRAMERSEFDKKLKEKELIGKRIREEQENAKMIEEEKEIKQMRRTMVSHARPVPNFDNPFHPQKSTKEKTKPKSPKLLVKQRERKHALHLR